VDATSQIPESVQALLRERIQSIEELEILLLLFSQPTRFWSEADIARELRTSSQLVGAGVRALIEGGLARKTDKNLFAFGPADAETDRVVRELTQVYNERRVDVLVFISESAISRVRHSALRTFAGAFRLTGRKKDG
jgi:hypothetical protein